MNKNEFMRKLKECLVGMNQTDKREILLDYEEHFLDGMKEGRTEEEICASLGDPSEIAGSLRKASEKANHGRDGMSSAGYIIALIALSLGCIWLLQFIFGVAGTIIGGSIGAITLAALPLSAMIKVTAISGIAFAVAISGLIVLGLIKLVILILRWYKNIINGLSKAEEKPIKRPFKMVKIPAWIWIVLVILAVASLGGLIYGGINVGIDAAERYERGEFDEIIERIEAADHDFEEFEDFEEWVDSEDWDDWNGAKFIFNSRFDNGFRRFGFMNFFTRGGKTVQLDEQLVFDGVENIYIGATSARLTVVSGNEGKATLTGTSVHSEKLYVENEGSTLRVEVQKERTRFGISNLHLEVVVPEDVYNELVVKNSSGRIEIDGVEAKVLKIDGTSGSIVVDGGDYSFEDVDIECSSGRIELKNIEDGGSLKLKNTSGSIKMSYLSFDDFDVSCSSGRIEGDDISGTMQVKSTSGSISIDGAIGDGRNKVECSSGRISLNIEEEPMKLSVKTNSGRVSVDESDNFTVSFMSNDGFAGEYSSESGETPTLEVESTSGSIEVNFK